MTLSLSAVALGAMHQMYDGLEILLTKAEAYAKEKEIEPDVILGWRIAPDMYGLGRQANVATELPVRFLARLAGLEPPGFGDDVMTFDGLKERIARARREMAAMSTDAIDADPDGPVTFSAGDRDVTLPRQVFLQNMLLPNLYFHVTAVHVILRNIGVDVGKRDFLAAPQE